MVDVSHDEEPRWSQRDDTVIVNEAETVHNGGDIDDWRVQLCCAL